MRLTITDDMVETVWAELDPWDLTHEDLQTGLKAIFASMSPRQLRDFGQQCLNEAAERAHKERA